MNDDHVTSQRTTDTQRLIEAALGLLIEILHHAYPKRRLAHALTHFQARTQAEYNNSMLTKLAVTEIQSK